MQKNTLAIIENQKGKILILKRNSKEKWYANQWCIIAEKIKEGEKPDECLKRGIFEETGIKKLKEVLKGAPYIFKDGRFKRKIYPYLCKVGNIKVRINREHSAYKWIKIQEFSKFKLAAPAVKQLNLFYSKKICLK